MSPSRYITAAQVFAAIKGLSQDAKQMLCEIIQHGDEWKVRCDSVKELEAAGLVYFEDGRVKLGKPS